MTDEALWTEADQARADLIADIACEISEDEDVVAMALDAYDARRNPVEAAAPDLYAALKDAEGAIASLEPDDFGGVFDGHGQQVGTVRDELLAKMRAALAKVGADPDNAPPSEDA